MASASAFFGVTAWANAERRAARGFPGSLCDEPLLSEGRACLVGRDRLLSLACDDSPQKGRVFDGPDILTSEGRQDQPNRTSGGRRLMSIESGESKDTPAFVGRTRARPD